MRFRNVLSATVLSCTLALAPLPAGAGPSTPSGWPTRIAETADALKDFGLGGSNVAARYGNWLGPGYWGGSESSTRPGMSPPVDDLDAVAQKHDFGYQLAEELGKGRPGVEGTYKLMADIIAIRDAMRLDSDPRRWAHPPKDPALASTFVRRMEISFEEFQTRYNRLKSSEMGRDDIGDLDTLNRMLDGVPDEATFENMQRQRVSGWQNDYNAWQARKRAVNTPTPTPSPKPAPVPVTRDCNQASMMERTLCLHDPSKERH
jgi:hypothetical protein